MRRFINHDDNRSQVMHFTRNYFQINKQEALSAKEFCILSQNFIKNTVMYSAKLMAEKHKIAKDLDQYHRKNLGLKLIGAALHTIQDSFAPAHTKRDPDSLLLEDICSFRNPYFGRNGPFKYSVNCVHTIFPSQRNFGGGSVLKDDQIWDRTQTSCQIQKDGRISKNFDCLTDYAQLATIVSGDFLESLVPFLNQSLQKRNVAYQDLEIVLDIFLNDYYPHKAKTLSLQGIMSCDGLAEFTPHTLFENY